MFGYKLVKEDLLNELKGLLIKSEVRCRSEYYPAKVLIDYLVDESIKGKKPLTNEELMSVVTQQISQRRDRWEPEAMAYKEAAAALTKILKKK